MSEVESTARYRPETRLVMPARCARKSAETSEGLFLTQGFVYAVPSSAKPASRAKIRAISIRAFPIQRSECSSVA